MDACVLVVDDDREIVRAIALLLEKEGYRVLKAYDGMEALPNSFGNRKSGDTWTTFQWPELGGSV